MEVTKRKQLHYLEEKYTELQKQYLYELTEGRSMEIILDLSFVLTTINNEINELKKDPRKHQPSG